MFEDIGTTLAGYGQDGLDWSKQNPGQLSWILGEMGAGVAPNNPMAALGKKIGPSLIAAKEAERARKEKAAADKQQATFLERILSGMTPGVENPGGNKVTIAPQPGGTFKVTHDSTIAGDEINPMGGPAATSTPTTTPVTSQNKQWGIGDLLGHPLA